MNDESTSVGELLVEAREQKGWTVEEAARRTKLNKDAIQKMEADEFELFPSISYARGFVRIYARELGLNGWELMRNFADAPDVPVEGLDLQPEDLEAIPKRKQPPVATSQGIGLFVMVLVFGAALLLLGIKAYQIWPSQNKEKVAAPQTVEPEVPEAKPVETTAVPAEVPTTVQALPATPTAIPVTPVTVAPAAVPVAPVAEPVAPAAAVAVPAVSANRLRLRANPNAPPRIIQFQNNYKDGTEHEPGDS